MKLIHISDLHIGKRVNEFSMIEDQKYILSQILSILKKVQADTLLISGDMYDKSIPPSDAVSILDDFLTQAVLLGIKTFFISGNHDSSERLDFGSRMLEKEGLFIASTFRGQMKKVTLKDEYGPIHFYLLPFVKPAVVRPYYKEEPISSYTTAIETVIKNTDLSLDERNIILSHQFVVHKSTQTIRSDSEQLSIGGLDEVDASVYDPFDYVALGHLHGPQMVKRETVRYAGSPLKYSFSETRQKKSVTFLEIKEKGNITFEKIPLTPLRDMREIKGKIEDLLKEEIVSLGNREDYIHATLTNEEPIIDAIGKMRSVYPNIMKLDFERGQQNPAQKTTSLQNTKEALKNPQELFSEFYQFQNLFPMTEEETETIKKTFQEVEGEGK